MTIQIIIIVVLFFLIFLLFSIISQFIIHSLFCLIFHNILSILPLES